MLSESERPDIALYSSVNGFSELSSFSAASIAVSADLPGFAGCIGLRENMLEDGEGKGVEDDGPAAVSKPPEAFASCPFFESDCGAVTISK